MGKGREEMFPFLLSLVLGEEEDEEGLLKSVVQ